MLINQNIGLLVTIGITIGIALVVIVAICLEPLPREEKLVMVLAPVALIAMLLLALVGASLERQTLDSPKRRVNRLRAFAESGLNARLDMNLATEVESPAPEEAGVILAKEEH